MTGSVGQQVIASPQQNIVQTQAQQQQPTGTTVGHPQTVAASPTQPGAIVGQPHSVAIPSAQHGVGAQMIDPSNKPATTDVAAATPVLGFFGGYSRTDGQRIAAPTAPSTQPLQTDAAVTSKVSFRSLHPDPRQNM